MKPWTLAFSFIALCTLTLGAILYSKIIPRVYANANAECVADWHAAISESRRDLGAWPDPANVEDFITRVLVVKSSDGRRIGKGYMTGRTGGYVNGVFYDIYRHPMRWSREGDHFIMASAGRNGTWGDADDITSDQVQERYQPTTLTEAREAAEGKKQQKSKAPSKSLPPDPQQASVPNPAP